jgi:hypothetical protein
MKSNVDTLARCHELALAEMERVAAAAAPPAGPDSGAELLAAFSPEDRAHIIAILDRLPLRSESDVAPTRFSSGGHGFQPRPGRSSARAASSKALKQDVKPVLRCLSTDR